MKGKFNNGGGGGGSLLGISLAAAGGGAVGVAAAAGLVLAAFDGRRRLRSINSILFSKFPFYFSGNHRRRQILEEDDEWVVPGLINYANNCFLNVIFQALASCSWFQSYLQNILDDVEPFVEDGQIDGLPLAVSLNALLKELSAVRHEAEVLSPQSVMQAIVHYIPKFNLTSQQDAEEAFCHILSSLKEEFLECYVLNNRFLADATVLINRRILAPKICSDNNEPRRWTRMIVGPFDGILGSTLTCRSCASKISLDFQFFHSLHLPPVHSGGFILPGCSVEYCLQQFFVAEQLENYCCSNCWHNAALKYLSIVDGNKTDCEKIKLCNRNDSCDCKDISRLGALPWSNSFSCTYKQLYVARAPKVLCLHIQRSFVNGFGGLVKIQGHISFPLTLNLYPFFTSGLDIESSGANSQIGKSREAYLQPFHYSRHLNVQPDTQMINWMYRQKGNPKFIEKENADELRRNLGEISVGVCNQACQEKARLVDPECCSTVTTSATPFTSLNDKAAGSQNLSHSGPQTYRLVSVVEHFGTSGSGHYTVYRRVNAKKNNGDLFEQSECRSDELWFTISDSQVYAVSEKDVLSANASMLFYERFQET